MTSKGRRGTGLCAEGSRAAGGGTLESGRNTPRPFSRQHRRYRRWRASYLVRHPLCELCAAEGLTVAAVELDHVVPLAKGGALMDEKNVEGLCGEHHRLKTATDFGFAPPSTLLPDAAAWDARLRSLR